jgi:hypothetical protein
MLFRSVEEIGARGIPSQLLSSWCAGSKHIEARKHRKPAIEQQNGSAVHICAPASRDELRPASCLKRPGRFGYNTRAFEVNIYEFYGDVSWSS